MIPEDAQPFFRELTRGAVKADEDEVARNPRSASVRLRGVDALLRLPRGGGDLRLGGLHVRELGHDLALELRDGARGGLALLGAAQLVLGLPEAGLRAVERPVGGGDALLAPLGRGLHLALCGLDRALCL